MIHCDLSCAHIDLDESHNADRVAAIHNRLHDPVTAMCGWVRLPETMDDAALLSLEQLANAVRQRCNSFVICGIGGSYLGTRAGIDLLSEPFERDRGTYGKPEILFAGQHLSSGYHHALFEHLRTRDFCVCVVSKSGTTLETRVVFAMLRDLLKKRWPETWRDRIIVITDPTRGDLRAIADRDGYHTLTIPPDVGGRYSVLSAVGLFPFAVAGLDIRAIISGARRAMKHFSTFSLDHNACYRYALARHLLHEKGYEMEIFEVYEGKMRYFTEWLRQLVAESECKNGGGLFPVAMQMSTDLHSLGQFLQDGRQNFIETVLNVASFASPLTIPDGCAGYCSQLNCLNRIIQHGVRNAHQRNNTPVITLTVRDISAATFGYVVYFFEKACAMSAALSGVNPFDQPGVEAYKRFVSEAIHSSSLKEESYEYERITKCQRTRP